MTKKNGAAKENEGAKEKGVARKEEEGTVRWQGGGNGEVAKRRERRSGKEEGAVKEEKKGLCQANDTALIKRYNAVMRMLIRASDRQPREPYRRRWWCTCRSS